MYLFEMGSLKCGICGANHSPMECDIIQVVTHIPDKIIPSRARLSLPDDLQLRILADCTYTVCAQFLIEKGTQFGPVQAQKLFTLLPSIDFPLKVFCNTEEDFLEYFLDTSNENESSWMMFIGAASSFEEQNLICYQDGQDLYYVAIRDIDIGEELKVWYSPYYATKMKQELLQPIKYEEDNVEVQCIDSLVTRKKNVKARDSWSCKFCGKVEKNLSEFATHLKGHYRTKLSKRCEICKLAFSRRESLQKHLKIVHEANINTHSEELREKKSRLIKVETEEPKDPCIGGPLLLNDITSVSLDNSGLILPQTDLSQFDLNNIGNQSRLLENENLILNDDNFLTENVKDLEHFNFDINERVSEQLVCDICLKNFKKLKNLIMHLDQHTGKFTCYECRKVFARKENLLYHPPCKSYYSIKCPLCEKLFSQRKYLTVHIKYFHNNVKKKQKKRDRDMFACEICSRKYSTKPNLVVHMKQHETPGESYTCLICNMILNSRKNYNEHLKLHEERVYQCDLCPKTFARNDYLKEHIKRVHNGKAVTCKICQKKISCQKLLKQHMVLHRPPEKKYKCHLCEAAFRENRYLKRHFRIHNSRKTQIVSFPESNKEFSCPKCNKKMKLKQSLKKHLRTIHPDYEYLSERKARASTKVNNKDSQKLCHGKEEELILDLKQTIENMDFDTDEINCSENNEINIEIDKLLNNTENIDTFLRESSDKIVESLFKSTMKDNNVSVPGSYQRDICLSMPELGADQEMP